MTPECAWEGPSTKFRGRARDVYEEVLGDPRFSNVPGLLGAAKEVTAARASNGAVSFRDFAPLKVLGVGGFGTVLLATKRAGYGGGARRRRRQLSFAARPWSNLER